MDELKKKTKAMLALEVLIYLAIAISLGLAIIL
jgi:hypothetical protein